jgi:uncharacterized membrane protein YedE/YeeE
MVITNPWTMAVLGGAMMGLSISMLLYFNGRIAGIGGITGNLLRPVRGDVMWRLMFLAGLVIAGAFLAKVEPQLFNLDGWNRSASAVVVSGIVMGFGGRMANGCTSGHGICGICQMSKRSLVATCVFFAAALLTKFAISHFFGGVL